MKNDKTYLDTSKGEIRLDTKAVIGLKQENSTGEVGQEMNNRKDKSL